MRVLVTGGAGFIGGNLCRELLARPQVDAVTVIDDLSTGSVDNIRGLDLNLVTGTILDRPLLAKAMSDADAVVHLAARPSVPKSLHDPVASHEANATGTLYLLEAARARGLHVVAASSSSVYGASAQLPKHEDMPTRPLSPYGVSKLAAEAYVSAYTHSFGLPALAFRFFNVYGPLQPAGHDYAAVVPAFIDSALAGRPVTIYGDGLQTRDFTFVGSVVRVLADAVTDQVTSEVPINLAFGTRHALLELVESLERVLGRPISVEHQPARRGDIRDSQASQERLRQLFPNALPVPLEQGLAATVEWFRAR